MILQKRHPEEPFQVLNELIESQVLKLKWELSSNLCAAIRKWREGFDFLKY